MGNHTETADASSASYTLHTRERALEELAEEHITSPYVLGLWNWVGDGIAIQGTRRELLTYLQLVTEHVTRETDPRGDLDQALRRLHTLREERGAALEAGDHAAVTRLDEAEVSVLDDVAHAAEVVNEEL